MPPDPKTKFLATYLLGLIALVIGLVLEAIGFINHSRPAMFVGLVFIVLGAAQIAWRLAQQNRSR